jgi:iron complex outermembrane receptor protein
MKKAIRAFRTTIFASSCLVSAHALAAAPADQDTPSVSDTTASGDSIVVTGSRIPRSTFEAPMPVTVVSIDDLQKSSPSTLAAALNNLPALVSNGGPNATSGQRTAGRNALNLRGIGTGRTLTLVNGRRFPGSQPGGTVDTNLIPQGLVSRVEVVTGGASAAYGSDAVAGVVNFILDSRFKGLKVNASVGIAEAGDGFEHRFGGTFGTSMFDNRLHITLSGEYYDADGIAGDARAWRRQGANLIANPRADGTAANPALIIADQARLSNATFGGYVASVSNGVPVANRPLLLGRQFLPGGTLGVFNPGINTTATFQDGGDGVNTATMQPITRPLRRITAYAGLEFEATDRLALFVSGGYGYSRSTNAATAFHAGRFGALITRQNAFLPDSVRSLMGTTGTFRLNRYDSEYSMEVVAKNNNYHLQAGLIYDLGKSRLELTGSIGKNTEVALNYRNFIEARFAQGVDTIVVNGAPACRDPSNGCVPINPFGAGSLTPQMIDWFTGTSLLETRVKQQIVQANLAGELFGGIGAGPWKYAVGAEYHHDEAAVIVDPISESLGYFTNNFRAWSADRSVREAFGELNAPILKDLPGAQLLELNGAIRRTSYTFSGAVTTWKIAGNYVPARGLRLRASYSADIRAPNQAEMFTRGRQTNSINYTDRDPRSPDFNLLVTGVLTSVQGNPGLVPERAKTLVLGAVLQPVAIPGLSLSIDRFDIRMRDAISSLSGQVIIDQCYTASFEQACAQIVRGSNGRIVQINNSNFNLDDLRLTGWDFEGSYRFKLGKGELALRSQVSLLERLRETDFQGNSIDRVGETTTPKWRALGSVTYTQGPLDLFLQGRYIGASKLNVNWIAADSQYNDVPAAMYLDGQIGYRIGKFKLTLNVQNLLNKAPVFAPQQDQYFNPTNPNVFDQIGRAYRLGISASF